MDFSHFLTARIFSWRLSSFFPLRLGRETVRAKTQRTKRRKTQKTRSVMLSLTYPCEICEIRALTPTKNVSVTYLGDSLTAAVVANKLRLDRSDLVDSRT